LISGLPPPGGFAPENQKIISQGQIFENFAPGSQKNVSQGQKAFIGLHENTLFD
jgi:hypothetical protein